MIFFRAFPLSLAILWRYAITLPVLFVGLLVFGLNAVILTLVAGLLSPLAGVMVMVAFAVGASVIPVMVALRVGLQSYHVKPRNSFFMLAKPAIGYGFFEAAVMLAMLAVAAGVFLLVTPLSPQDLLSLGAGGTEAMLEVLLNLNAALTFGTIGVIFLSAIALRAALLVPFTGASVGKDPTGRAHTPFYGFGMSFVPIFLLVIVSQIGLAATGPIVVAIMMAIGMGDTLVEKFDIISATSGIPDFSIFGPELLVATALVLLFVLFFFSLQCAGPVLVYMDERRLVGDSRDAFHEKMAAEEEARRPQMADVDLRELVRSRMPQKQQ